MRLIKKCLIIGAALTLTACGRGMVSSDILNKDPETGSNNIYRTYKLSYSEVKNQMHGAATFHLKNSWGDYVELKSPSAILLNGTELGAKVIRDEQDGGELAAFYAGFLNPIFWFYLGDDSSANYSSLRSGFVADNKFEFIDQFGEKVADSASLRYFHISHFPYLRENDKSLSLQVLDQGHYDSYTVQVKVKKQGVSTSRSVTRSSSNIVINFTDGELQGARSVVVEVMASKTKTLSNNKNEGGKLTMSYMKAPVTLPVR